MVGAFDEKGLGAIVNSSRAVLTAWQKQERPGEEYAQAARQRPSRMAGRHRPVSAGNQTVTAEYRRLYDHV